MCHGRVNLIGIYFSMQYKNSNEFSRGFNALKLFRCRVIARKRRTDDVKSFPGCLVTRRHEWARDLAHVPLIRWRDGVTKTSYLMWPRVVHSLLRRENVTSSKRKSKRLWTCESNGQKTQMVPWWLCFGYGSLLYTSVGSPKGTTITWHNWKAW